jgi:hypothetical protein
MPNIFIYGAFLFLTIYSYTELMDTRTSALFWEGLRLLFGIAIVLSLGDWFGLNGLTPFGNYSIIGYLLFSISVTVYFVFFVFKKVPAALQTT